MTLHFMAHIFYILESVELIEDYLQQDKSRLHDKKSMMPLPDGCKPWLNLPTNFLLISKQCT